MQYIKSASNRRQRTRRILVAIIGISLVMGLISAWDWGKNELNWQSILGNLSTELLGGVITYFIIDQLISKNEEDESLKVRLIRELENPDNGIVARAAQELRTHGWLDDGSLYGWFLQRANFEGVYLRDADVRGLGLYRSKLTDARIDESQLVLLNDLRSTIMPDGKIYDGRYCLKGDIDWALSKYDLDFSTITVDEMATYYGVTTAEFVQGQKWAKNNLPNLGRALPNYLMNLTFDEETKEQ